MSSGEIAKQKEIWPPIFPALVDFIVKVIVQRSAYHQPWHNTHEEEINDGNGRNISHRPNENKLREIESLPKIKIFVWKIQKICWYLNSHCKRVKTRLCNEDSWHSQKCINGMNIELHKLQDNHLIKWSCFKDVRSKIFSSAVAMTDDYQKSWQNFDAVDALDLSRRPLDSYQLFPVRDQREGNQQVVWFWVSFLRDSIIKCAWNHQTNQSCEGESWKKRLLNSV